MRRSPGFDDGGQVPQSERPGPGDRGAEVHRRGGRPCRPGPVRRDPAGRQRGGQARRPQGRYRGAQLGEPVRGGPQRLDGPPAQPVDERHHGRAPRVARLDGRAGARGVQRQQRPPDPGQPRPAADLGVEHERLEVRGRVVEVLPGEQAHHPAGAGRGRDDADVGIGVVRRLAEQPRSHAEVSGEQRHDPGGQPSLGTGQVRSPRSGACAGCAGSPRGSSPPRCGPPGPRPAATARRCAPPPGSGPRAGCPPRRRGRAGTPPPPRSAHPPRRAGAPARAAATGRWRPGRAAACSPVAPADRRRPRRRAGAAAARRPPSPRRARTRGTPPAPRLRPAAARLPGRTTRGWPPPRGARSAPVRGGRAAPGGSGTGGRRPVWS